MAVGYYDLYCESEEKLVVLQNKYDHLNELYKSERRRNKYLEEHMEEMINKSYLEKLSEMQEELDNMKKENERLKSILNNDGSNAGIPTSQTPINKKKRIPNSRTRSGKKKGGQKNHPKHKLERFADHEITDVVEHRINECPVCHAAMIPTGKTVTKDEYELEIVVKKIRHCFMETRCEKCGHTEMMKIPTRLKEDNQYGGKIQAVALTMMNEGFVSMQRTKEIITGFTKGEVNLSEGYLAKIQKRLAEKLDGFINELKQSVIKLDVLHWDDTVIFISTNRACLRFYGDSSYALYTAHTRKNKEGLDEDCILNSLSQNTAVVHDHNRINYNEEYVFQNVECCVHLLRDIYKVDQELKREWTKQLINLLIETNIKRNNEEWFDAEVILSSYDSIVKEGEKENKNSEDSWYLAEEKKLLRRLKEYKENYMLWVVNERIPFSNNESERSLRSSKTKMKISGQFDNLNRARDYAKIKSYIETGKRFGYNPIYLIKRALEDSFVTIDEMKENLKACEE